MSFSACHDICFCLDRDILGGAIFLFLLFYDQKTCFDPLPSALLKNLRFSNINEQLWTSRSVMFMSNLTKLTSSVKQQTQYAIKCRLFPFSLRLYFENVHFKAWGGV